MSGGVDSSVAAMLLKQNGFEVIGVTYQIWDRPKAGEGCCGLDSAELARASADRLGIRHYMLNFREAFNKAVVEPFCREYLLGRTPNPCVECNRMIKFGKLIDKAAELGADFIATGHYARIEKSEKGWLLKKGVDPRKDQSYFLYTITQRQLAVTLMPLGELSKVEVRKIAEDAGLPAAGSPESQEICFITDNDYRKFLSDRFPEEIKPGKIMDTGGNVLGTHRGIPFYTIGQRRGLDLNAGRPYFVIGIEKNDIIVGGSEEVFSRECAVRNLNLITGGLPPDGRAGVKIRHPGQPRAASVELTGEHTAKVHFDEPKWAVTEGQSAVFYDGDTVVGGGIISKPGEHDENRTDVRQD